MQFQARVRAGWIWRGWVQWPLATRKSRTFKGPQSFAGFSVSRSALEDEQWMCVWINDHYGGLSWLAHGLRLSSCRAGPQSGRFNHLANWTQLPACFLDFEETRAYLGLEGGEGWVGWGWFGELVERTERGVQTPN